MIDSVIEYLPRALETEPWRTYGVDQARVRTRDAPSPSLVDDPGLLARTLERPSRLSEHVPIVFPVHPRTRSRIEALGTRNAASKRLLLVEPLGYLPFLGLQARARFVLTDSGGVQEETSALGTPCFTLRDSTERPITITHGTNVLLGAEPERILDIDFRAAGNGDQARADPTLGRRGGDTRRRHDHQGAQWIVARRAGAGIGRLPRATAMGPDRYRGCG